MKNTILKAEDLSLFENVVVPGLCRTKSDNESVYKRASELLEKFQLAEAKNRLPSQVSGGEQQRAAIARALINEQGQSIVMVTHDRKAALRANRILYIIDGRIEGELELSPYKESQLKGRETQVNAWLESLAW